MMSWPASPRIRMRPIGPGSPMRRLGSPRSIFAGGASDKSGKWPSRVCTTSISLARAAASTAAIGFTARASCETSLPSVSPKPPGSMKSRCMSMMRSAVADQSRSIGVGSATTVPLKDFPEFAMTCTRPERENSRKELSKAYAIVYNAPQHRFVSESFVFSVSCISSQGLHISQAELSRRAIAHSLGVIPVACLLRTCRIDVAIASMPTHQTNIYLPLHPHQLIHRHHVVVQVRHDP